MISTECSISMKVAISLEKQYFNEVLWICVKSRKCYAIVIELFHSLLFSMLQTFFTIESILEFFKPLGTNHKESEEMKIIRE